MDYEAGELAARIESIFNPEPIVGSEGIEYYETPPLDRLKTEFGLDLSYWRRFEYGSSSELVRRAVDDDKDLEAVIQAQQVPFELFFGTLRLFGDSILEYHSKRERIGPYRYYPAILMSACASFESFVRVYSELLVKTSSALPSAVKLALLEKDEFLDDGGQVRTRNRPRPLLDRYSWLLKFGYGLEYARGNRIWQMGERALSKRNKLVHYEILTLPSLTATEICAHLEAILLLLIGPSEKIRKSVMPNQYELYGMLDELRSLVEEFEEQTFFKDKRLKLGAVCFDCAFENVDESHFPTRLSLPAFDST